MNRDKFTSGLMGLVFGSLFFAAHARILPTSTIVSTFFAWWPMLMIVPAIGLILFPKDTIIKKKELGDPRREAGIFLIIVGILFLLFFNGFAIEFLAYPFVFPMIMMLFGAIQLVIAVFNTEVKMLEFIIFIWLVATFFAYLPTLSFNVFVPFTQESVYTNDYDFSTINSAIISTTFGSISVRRGEGNIYSEYAISEPKITKTDSSLRFESTSSNTTVKMNRNYSQSSLTLKNTFGSVNAASLMNFSNTKVDVSFGSVNLVIDQNIGNIDVDVTFGSINIVLPEDTEYNIVYSTTFGSFSGSGSCSMFCDGTLQSSEYIQGNGLNIVVDTIFGSINIANT